MPVGDEPVAVEHRVRHHFDRADVDAALRGQPHHIVDAAEKLHALQTVRCQPAR